MKKSMKFRLALSAALTMCVIAQAKTGKELISENGLRSSVEPMLTTHWSQDGGENSLLPIVSSDGTTHAKTGCGATAMAQIMRYWKYPAHGTGWNYYVWQSPVDDSNNVRSADFEAETYDWDNMIDVYKGNGNVTDVQTQAVGRLMNDIGIALEMKYKESSTATQIEYIFTALRKYFGYNPNMRLLRLCNGAYTTDEWLLMIYRELSAGRPVLLGGAYNDSNHIYVADGYNAEGEIHLNLGHANQGSSINLDTYFDLSQTGKTYNEDMRMIVGISPDTLATDMTTVNVATAGTLKTALGDSLNRVCRLKVTGTINASDVSVLSDLTLITTGQLSYIDLSECDIDGNKLPDNAFSSNNYSLQEIVLPNSLTAIGNNAFKNCAALYHVTLPSGLITIGNFAFSNCRYLTDVSIPVSVTSIGVNPFRHDKIENLNIASGNTTYALDNNAIVTQSISPQLVSMPLKTKGEYVVPEGVTSIGQQAFQKSCMISGLRLPASMSTIKTGAFGECYSLSEVYSQNAAPPTLASTSVFADEVKNAATLYVPTGSLDAYQTAYVWKDFQNIKEYDFGGIDTITANDTSTGGCFDLQGRKLAEPQHGNINIINGKKVLVK